MPIMLLVLLTVMVIVIIVITVIKKIIAILTGMKNSYPKNRHGQKSRGLA